MRRSGPDGSDGLDVTFEQMDDAPRFEIDDTDGTVVPACSEELTIEESSVVESSADCSSVQADVDALGDILSIRSECEYEGKREGSPDSIARDSSMSSNVKSSQDGWIAHAAGRNSKESCQERQQTRLIFLLFPLWSLEGQQGPTCPQDLSARIEGSCGVHCSAICWCRRSLCSSLASKVVDPRRHRRPAKAWCGTLLANRWRGCERA